MDGSESNNSNSNHSSVPPPSPPPTTPTPDDTGSPVAAYPPPIGTPGRPATLDLAPGRRTCSSPEEERRRSSAETAPSPLPWQSLRSAMLAAEGTFFPAAGPPSSSQQLLEPYRVRRQRLHRYASEPSGINSSVGPAPAVLPAEESLSHNIRTMPAGGGGAARGVGQPQQQSNATGIVAEGLGCSRGTSTPSRVARTGSMSSALSRRLHDIRRESFTASYSQEISSERQICTAAQAAQVLSNFEGCSLNELPEERKRTKSLCEPISVLTSHFLPQSCSPSPTRGTVDSQKQCYSPSAQQVVRHNIAFSPSPSPTPSPTNRRLMRSLSPIATRPLCGLLGVKRKAAGESGGPDMGRSRGATPPLEGGGPTMRKLTCPPTALQRPSSRGSNNSSTGGCPSPLVPERFLSVSEGVKPSTSSSSLDSCGGGSSFAAAAALYHASSANLPVSKFPPRFPGLSPSSSSSSLTACSSKEEEKEEKNGGEKSCSDALDFVLGAGQDRSLALPVVGNFFGTINESDVDMTD